MVRLTYRLDLTMASGWDVEQKTKPKTKEPENGFQELVILYSSIVWSQINQNKTKKKHSIYPRIVRLGIVKLK